MLLLDDGTPFTTDTSAATKPAKASRPVGLKWMHLMHRVHWQLQPQRTQPQPVQLPTQVFLDSVVQRVMARPSIPQQPVRQQPVRQQRSILKTISSQLSALPPPVVRQPISPPAIV